MYIDYIKQYRNQSIIVHLFNMDELNSNTSANTSSVQKLMHLVPRTHWQVGLMFGFKFQLKKARNLSIE